MVYEKILFVGIFVLLLMPIVFAGANVEIRTLKNHRISLIARNAGELTILESYPKDTGNGNLTIQLLTNNNFLDLIVTLNKDGNKILNEPFKNVENKEPIIINLIPGKVELITKIETKIENETLEVNETSEVNENETAITGNPADEDEKTEEIKMEIAEGTNGAITGSAIKKTGFLTTKKISYIIGVVIGIVFLLMIIIYTRKKMTKDKENFSEFKIKPASDVKVMSSEQRLADAERKIKDAEDEINRIKNRKYNEERLKQAEEKFRRDQEELRKLREEL